MGGIVSKNVKEVLQKYTFNFEPEQFSLNIFKGMAKIENLLLNHHKINEHLNQLNFPVNLRFGLLKRFELKVSYLS
jgi:hypothetical protein